MLNSRQGSRGVNSISNTSIIAFYDMNTPREKWECVIANRRNGSWCRRSGSTDSAPVFESRERRWPEMGMVMKVGVIGDVCHHGRWFGQNQHRERYQHLIIINMINTVDIVMFLILCSHHLYTQCRHSCPPTLSPPMRDPAKRPSLMSPFKTSVKNSSNRQEQWWYERSATIVEEITHNEHADTQTQRSTDTHNHRHTNAHTHTQTHTPTDRHKPLKMFA